MGRCREVLFLDRLPAVARQRRASRARRRNIETTGEYDSDGCSVKLILLAAPRPREWERMDAAEFDRVADAFAVFHQQFAPLFGRPEAQDRSEQYVRGLLVQRAERRNVENLAEAVSAGSPRGLQRFVTDALVHGPAAPTGGTRFWARDSTRPTESGCSTTPVLPSRGRTRSGWPGSIAGRWARSGIARWACSSATPRPWARAGRCRLFLPRAWTDAPLSRGRGPDDRELPDETRAGGGAVAAGPGRLAISKAAG